MTARDFSGHANAAKPINSALAVPLGAKRLISRRANA
jgi:hypothetical protein